MSPVMTATQTLGVRNLLTLVAFLAQVATGCYVNCCCRNGESMVDCHTTRLAPLPPLPTAKDKWCGGNSRNLPEGENITKISMMNTTVDQIDKDALSKYPNVKEVSVAYSRFQSLDARAFIVSGSQSHLEEIDAKGNKISTLHEEALEGLSQLKRIYLTGNRIETIPVGFFTKTANIETIRLDKNLIRDLKTEIFFELFKLAEIDLSSNLIEEIPDFPKLVVTTLRLGNNSIKSLRSDVFRNLKQLQVLDLKENELTGLPADIFSENYYLRFIYLSNNSLTSIGKDTFNNLCLLRHLDLRHNKLTTVYVEWFASVALNSDEQTASDYGPEQEIDRYPANEGNPWTCGENDVNIMKFALFLSELCHFVHLKRIGLTKHLNLKCPRGQMLIEESSCNSSVEDLAVKEKEEILSQNKDGFCKNVTDIPPCHFVSSHCANPEKRIPPLPPPPAPVNLSTLFVIMAFIVIILTATLAFVGYNIFHRRAKKRSRYPSGDFSDSSDEESFSVGSNLSANDSSVRSETEQSTSPEPSEDSPSDSDLVETRSQDTQTDLLNHIQARQQYLRYNHLFEEPEHRFASVSHPFPCHPPLSDTSLFHMHSIRSLSFESFSLFSSCGNRPDPLGSSQNVSTATSVTSYDTDIDHVTQPKEPLTVSDFRRNSFTQPKSVYRMESEEMRFSVPPQPDPTTNPKEVIPPEVPPRNVNSITRPKTVNDSMPGEDTAETCSRQRNVYITTPERQLPQQDLNDPSVYVPMAPLLNVPPPIPPRKHEKNNAVGAQNIPQHPPRTGPPAQPPPHRYCYDINPPQMQRVWSLAASATNNRPLLPTPTCVLHSGCYLHHPLNPVHIPYVVYREQKFANATGRRKRLKSDQQPLLIDTTADTSTNDKSKREKRCKKKKETKGGKHGNTKRS